MPHFRDLAKATILSRPAVMFPVFRSLIPFCNTYPQVSREYLLIGGRVVTERYRFLTVYYRLELIFKLSSVLIIGSSRASYGNNILFHQMQQSLISLFKSVDCSVATVFQN